MRKAIWERWYYNTLNINYYNFIKQTKDELYNKEVNQPSIDPGWKNDSGWYYTKIFRT